MGVQATEKNLNVPGLHVLSNRVENRVIVAKTNGKGGIAVLVSIEAEAFETIEARVDVAKIICDALHEKAVFLDADTCAAFEQSEGG